MRQSIIGFISGVAALLFLVGCRENPVRARLAEIESFAESYPDSARQSLEAIDPSLLNTRRLQAQYALMLSTALNRCGVKVPNDSLISIAVDYHERFGSRKDKFLSYYYQGRVYQDLEDYESAMYSYLEAESIHSKDIPLKYLTSLQILKGEIYQHYYDYDKSVEAYRKAQRFALQCEWKANYFSALIGELSQHVICDDVSAADSLIRIIEPYRGEMGVRSRRAFDNDVILFSLANNVPKDSVSVLVKAYEKEYSYMEDFPWTVLAFFYTRIGNFTDAERALAQSKESRIDLNYLHAYSALNDSLGFHKEGREAQEEFQGAMGKKVYEKGISDLRFLEERKAKDKLSKAQNQLIVLFSFAFILLCCGIFFGIRNRKLKKEEANQMYASLREEFEGMSALLRSNNGIQEGARTLLGERVKALARFLSADPPSSLDRVKDQIDSLTENRKELLETIGLLYAVYHPAFVNRLQECGLSSGEIGYCCLLVLGFRTGEIGEVINRSSVYHISSVIRQKVGLGPNDTNLSIFLKKLFQETGS